MSKRIYEFSRKKPSSRTRVFLPAERSFTYGWFFQQLGLDGRGGRPERWKALMVAFMGKVNPIPCQECLLVYERSVTSTREHVNSPFFDCTSHPGSFGGACAGCIYNGKQGQCSWVRYNGYLPKTTNRQEASQLLSGKSSLPATRTWFTTPHPMSSATRIPGSPEYLSWDVDVQSLQGRQAIATRLWSNKKAQDVLKKMAQATY
jgi:hypothetical protein